MSVVVAIVGRPNVGKSTFFNRLVGSRDAIVDEYSGVTRDRHYGKTEWNATEFNLIDTGGYIGNSEELFDVEIRKQVEIAIEEAHAIVFVVDGNPCNFSGKIHIFNTEQREVFSLLGVESRLLLRFEHLFQRSRLQFYVERRQSC